MWFFVAKRIFSPWVMGSSWEYLYWYEGLLFVPNSNEAVCFHMERWYAQAGEVTAPGCWSLTNSNEELVLERCPSLSWSPSAVWVTVSNHRHPGNSSRVVVRLWVMAMGVFWIRGTGNSCTGTVHFWESAHRMDGESPCRKQSKLETSLVSVSWRHTGSKGVWQRCLDEGKQNTAFGVI